MSTIQELRAGIQRDIDNLERQINSDRSEIKAALDNASAQGRNALTLAEDTRAEALFRSIEAADAAKRRKADALTRAIAIEDEEKQQETRLLTTHSTNAGRANRTTSFSITRNERTYRPDKDPAGTEFVADVCRAQVGGDPNAWDRLNRHMDEERIERGPYMQRAAGDVLTSGMGGLVVPQYLVDLTAPAVAARRPFADSCTSHELPAEGMSMTIPTITTATAATLQTTQLTAVGTQSMAETDLTILVKTAAGSQNVSRQAADRSRVDEFVLNDLLARVATTLDNELINGAVTGLDAVASGVAASTPTYDKIYPAILGRQAGIEAALLGGAVDTVVMHSRRWAALSAALTSQWPFVSDQGEGPGTAATIQSHGYGSAVRGTLPNGLRVVVDNNIVTNKGAGTNEDVIYVVPSFEAHLWEAAGSPVMIRAEQPNAANLGILIVVFEYFAYTFQRYALAMGKVTGLTPPTF